MCDSLEKCRPGPAKYTLPTTIGFKDHTLTKNRGPAYSFGSRIKDRVAVATPGPKYDIPSSIGGRNKTYEKSAQYSLRGRLSNKEMIRSPGPSAYSLQNFRPGKRAPCYTIGNRLSIESHELEC